MDAQRGPWESEPRDANATGAPRAFPEWAMDFLLPRQRSLLEAIQSHPGIEPRHLARQLGLTRGDVYPALQDLAMAGLVERHGSPRRPLYFAAGAADPRWVAAAPALRSDGAKRLLAALARLPDGAPSSGALARMAGLTPRGTAVHLRRLVAADLVVLAVAGKCLEVRLTPTGRLAASGELAALSAPAS